MRHLCLHTVTYTGHIHVFRSLSSCCSNVCWLNTNSQNPVFSLHVLDIQIVLSKNQELPLLTSLSQLCPKLHSVIWEWHNIFTILPSNYILLASNVMTILLGVILLKNNNNISLQLYIRATSFTWLLLSPSLQKTENFLKI